MESHSYGSYGDLKIYSKCLSVTYTRKSSWKSERWLTDKFGGLIYGESCAKNIEQTIDVDLSVKSLYSVATECGSWL